MKLHNENTGMRQLKIFSLLSKLVPRGLKKLIPRYNVHEEETKDKIEGIILDHTEFFHTSPGVENKIELIFCKPATGSVMHYILRCNPTVREMIYKNHDFKIRTEYTQ